MPPGWIRTRNPREREAANLRLKTRVYWNQLSEVCYFIEVVGPIVPVQSGLNHHRWLLNNCNITLVSVCSYLKLSVFFSMQNLKKKLLQTPNILLSH